MHKGPPLIPDLQSLPWICLVSGQPITSQKRALPLCDWLSLLWHAGHIMFAGKWVVDEEVVCVRINVVDLEGQTWAYFERVGYGGAVKK